VWLLVLGQLPLTASPLLSAKVGQLWLAQVPHQLALANDYFKPALWLTYGVDGNMLMQHVDALLLSVLIVEL
jgi:hypothetical protein